MECIVCGEPIGEDASLTDENDYLIIGLGRRSLCRECREWVTEDDRWFYGQPVRH
jgi:hypothetical protein